MRCPSCHEEMEEGSIPAYSTGILWFRKGVKPRVDITAEALPGTGAYLRFSRLKAHICRGCQLVTFRYGKAMGEEDEEAAGGG